MNTSSLRRLIRWQWILVLVGIACAASPQVVPSAQVLVQRDSAKTDPSGKYVETGELRMSNLFQRDGQHRDVVFRVTVSKGPTGRVLRSYDVVPTSNSMGASASFLMSDGGIATFTIPSQVGASETVLKLSQDKVEMTVMLLPAKGVMTVCYLGKEVFSGGLRFVACGLGHESLFPAPEPFVGFVDAEIVPAKK